MRFFACSLVLSALLASASAAHADAVPPPPRNCPDGSVGETGHFGPYCRPLSCANDSECAVYGPELTCQPTSLCIVIVEHTDWNGQTYQVATVTGTCGPDASCPPDATCDDSPKCSAVVSTTTSSSSGGSTTGPGPGPGSSGAGASGAGGEGGEGADGEEPDRRIEGCGCTVPGGRAGGAAALLAGLALLVGTGVRRRRRAV